MTTTINTSFTETVMERIAAGTAPIMGPKYGIIFVMPMIIPSKSAYGTLKNQNAVVAIAPMMRQTKTVL